MMYVGLNDPFIDMIADLYQYEFTDREQPVSNEDYGYENDCTAEAPSRAFTPSATRIPETLYTVTRVGESVDGGEVIRGLFD